MTGKEILIDEIEKAAKKVNNMAWINYSSAYIVAWVSVAGSIAATILAAVQMTPGWVTATVAAIPAAVLAINTTFNFERRAIWHWRSKKLFEGLVRQLKYQEKSIASVSKQFTELDIKTYEGWIAFSNLSDIDKDDNNNNNDSDGSTLLSEKETESGAGKKTKTAKAQ